MSTFIYFAGFILLILVLKFIYDSYLTDNTEREWERYKSDFPEKARKIEGVSRKQEIEDGFIDSDDEEKKFSIGLMAKGYECEPWEVKRFYLEEIKKNNFHKMSFEDIKKIISPNIEKQALMFNIKKENTGAAIALKWVEEAFFNSEIKPHLPTDDEVREWFLSKKAKFAYDFMTKDCVGIYELIKKDFNNFTNNTSDWFDIYITPMLDKDNGSNLSEINRQQLSYVAIFFSTSQSAKASFTFYFVSAIIDEFEKTENRKILGQGLSLIDKALNDIDESIPQNFNIVYLLLQKKSEILLKLCIYSESMKYEEQAKEFKVLAEDFEKK